jgi:DNA-binding response OmpR family regulator
MATENVSPVRQYTEEQIEDAYWRADYGDEAPTITSLIDELRRHA